MVRGVSSAHLVSAIMFAVHASIVDVGCGLGSISEFGAGRKPENGHGGPDGSDDGRTSMKNRSVGPGRPFFAPWGNV